MKAAIASILLLAAASAVAASPAETFSAVCASAFVKSDKLEKACRAGELPRVIKDGSRFDARGIGAEVNTLAANLHLLAK